MEKAFQSFRKHEKNNPKSKEYDKQFGYTIVKRKPKRKGCNKIMRVLLEIDMDEQEYEVFKRYITKEMIVDIGVDYDEEGGWMFIRRALLCVKPCPKRRLTVGRYENGIMTNGCEYAYSRGWNACIDAITGEEE